MSFSEDAVKKLVRTTLLRTLGQAQRPDAPAQPGVSRRAMITEADVNASAPGSTLQVPQGVIVTPLARQAARERGVTLQEPLSANVAERLAGKPVPAKNTLAVGADHGGFALKQTLIPYLAELGYEATDCGTYSTDAVDYPDFAYAVAQLVSDGKAWRGIVIDGAGIGSCMAANKVPGIRAAMCYDVSTALNSREHNDANVLTLGGGLIGTNLAKQIVKTWLETDFGGDRHARRVNKIMGIERRYLRK
jgi:ribose 5-phosphate isomerase B